MIYKNFTFEVIDSNKLVLLKYNGDNTKVNIPNIIDDKYEVIGIKKTAFKECYRLDYIKIPRTIKEIEEDTFKDCYYALLLFEGHNKFKSEYNPLKLNEFYGVDEEVVIDGFRYACLDSNEAILLDYEGREIDIILSSKVLDKYKLKYIAPYAFSEKKIESIDFNHLDVTIYQGAFYFCIELKDIKNYESINYIGEVAFHQTAIKHIKIPRKVETIEFGAFGNCENLLDVEFHDKVTHIKSEAFFHCSNLRDLYLPDSLVYIGVAAFAHNSGINSIVIPKSVKKIDDRAFYINDKLASIIILDDRVDVGIEALNGNTFTHVYTNYYHPVEEKEYSWQKGLKVNTGANYVKEINGIKYLVTEYDLAIVVGYSSKIKEKTYILDHVDDIPVTRISDFAFMYANIKEIFIPKTIVNLGNFTFKRCKNLEKIYIEELSEIYRNIITDTNNVKIMIAINENETYEN